MLAAVGSDAGIRNLIVGVFGVLLATVGLDLTTGTSNVSPSASRN